MWSQMILVAAKIGTASSIPGTPHSQPKKKKGEDDGYGIESQPVANYVRRYKVALQSVQDPSSWRDRPVEVATRSGRLHRARLDSSEQDENQNDCNNQAKPAGRIVAPTAAIRPGWQSAD
jgi:hypothetical protein